ncbi:hypothetical protein WS50_27135 [Burkholderia territorii]|nr:hypothetical protein WS47_28530 [Burkholderia territorii]KUZ07309.1 hypothetical protein WS50_27135 [Burkholderia territorii]
MNVSAALETNTEATEMMKSGMRALDGPAIFAKAAAIFGAALGDNQLAQALREALQRAQPQAEQGLGPSSA